MKKWSGANQSAITEATSEVGYPVSPGRDCIQFRVRIEGLAPIETHRAEVFI